MGLVFQKLHQQPLSVYFRRISTGDGELEVPAGLNEVSLAKTAKAVSELDYNDAVEKEIIGCWYQRQTVSHTYSVTIQSVNVSHIQSKFCTDAADGNHIQRGKQAIPRQPSSRGLF